MSCCVEGQIANLPVGLVLGRSVGPIPDSYDPVNIVMGCAVTHNVLGTQFYASDFRAPAGTSVANIRNNYTVHWGPFPTEAQARANVDSFILDKMDSEGSSVVSLWLVLP